MNWTLIGGLAGLVLGIGLGLGANVTGFVLAAYGLVAGTLAAVLVTWATGREGTRR